jgi:sulfur carrier protein
MEITLNGNAIDTQSITLAALVAEKGLMPDALVAEVNLKVIPQSDWRTFEIRHGDTIELLNFVGGG